MHHRHRFWIETVLAAGMADFAGAATITVNTAADDFNSVNTGCSLREAIQAANTDANFGGCTHVQMDPYGDDIIVLPQLGAGGFFTLTRVDDATPDDNAAGDLDIAGNLRIDGFSTENSVIRGDTSAPDSSRHRLLHVISGTVTLNDLTLRNGLEDGSGAGGGLRSEPGSTTTLNRVTVTQNIAGGNAGGILNRGILILNDSLVSLNQTLDASLGGGGIFSSPNATLTINDSRVLNNTVKPGNAGEASGGGIYSDTDATLTLDNSVVDGNIADGRRLGGDKIAQGGGIHVRGTFNLVQSSVTNNEAVGDGGLGGGIYIGLGLTLVDRSVISFNLARSSTGAADGGGIVGSATIQDSVISSNEARSDNSARGGGMLGLTYRIVRSTIANNFLGGNAVGEGGGMYIGDSAVIVHSTFIGNQSTGSGGAILPGGFAGTSRIFGSTIAGNTAVTGSGGLSGTSGGIRIANTVLAGNTDSNGASDCDGSLTSDGYNLVQSTIGCSIVTSTGDKGNMSAGLAAVANNGGPTAGSSHGIISAMQTRSPLPGSPLLDAGNPGGCRDDANAILTTDQIGRVRALDGPDGNTTATCDIGAIEFIDPDVIFANGFE